MIRKMLLATDGSEVSARALEVAAELARFHQASLIVAHAIDENLLPSQHGGAHLVDRVDVRRTWRAEGDAVLAAARERLLQLGLEVETSLLESEHLRVDDQIAEAVHANQVQLLVVGSHGRRGLQRLFLGSVAEKLARKVDCSILIVKGNT